MNTILILLMFLFFNRNLFANPIACPVCAVMIVSGLSISRLLGVNDYVVGIWTGALILAMSNGITIFLKKKNINNKLLNVTIYIADYCMIIPLYIGKNPQLIFNSEKILFIDAFIFSMAVGSLVLFTTSRLYYYMKSKNNNKAHFPFEKVVLPVVVLVLVSVVFQYMF